MAIYYVDKLGSDTSPYDTWEKAANLIQTAMNDATSAGDIVEIDTNTYTEALDTKGDGSEGNPITIKASQEAGHSGTVLIDPSAVGDEGIEGAHSWITWEDIGFKGADVGGPPANNIYVQSGGSNWHFKGCTLDVGRRLMFYDGTAKNVIFDFCKIRSNGNTDEMFYLFNSNVIFRYCFFTPNEDWNRWFKLEEGSQLTLYNCVLVGFKASVIKTYDATAEGVIKNCSFIAHNAGRAGGEYQNIIDDSGGGSFTFDYNHWLPNVWDPGDNIGVVDGGHSITNSFPKFQKLGRNKGYICYSVDDGTADGLAYAKDIMTVCNTKGVKFTYFVDQKRMMDQSGYAAELQAFVAAGHEIGCHSYSHISLTATYAFKVQGSGTTPTVDIDRPGDQIVCNDVETGNNIVAGYKAKTVATIMAEINAFANFTASDKVDAFGYVDVAYGEILEDTAGAQACVALYSMPLDKTVDCSQGLYKSEIADVKSWIETTIGGEYVCNSFAYPGGKFEVATLSGVESAGFLGARATRDETANVNLKDLEICKISTCPAQEIYPDKLENTLKINSMNLGCMAMISAEITAFCTHTPGNDFTTTQFGWLIDGLKEVLNLEIVGFGTAFNHIRTSGFWADADGDGERWTRTFEDGSDYSVDSDSPLIDKGVGVGLTEDFGGNNVPSGDSTDIGLYEYQDEGWSAGKILGIVDVAEIMDIDINNISKVMGI